MKKTLLVLPLVVAGVVLAFALRPEGGPRDAARSGVIGARSLLAMRDEDPEVVRLRRAIERELERHRFRRVLELGAELRRRLPADRWTAAVLSDAHLELGDVESAERELQTILDVKPCGAAYFRAAHLFRLRGETGRAIETMRMAADALDPKDRESRAMALTELGDLLWNRGDVEAAEREYRLALEIDAKHHEAHAGLGRIAGSRGDLAEAIRRFEMGDTPALMSELASYYEEAGRPADARRAAARAADFVKEDATWARSVALALADHGIRADEAVDLARRELEDRPSVEGWDAVAWSLCAAGRFDEALEAARKALALGTRDPLPLFHAGMAAAGAGREEEARRWLGEALALNPRFHIRHATRARETLNGLQGR